MARTMSAPKPETRIVKHGTGHSYYLDGDKTKGVTTALDDGIAKPFLVGWAARTVAEYVMERLHSDGGHIVADELVADLRKFNDTRKTPMKLGQATFPRVPLTQLLGQVQYAERDAAAKRGTEVHRLAEQLARGEEVEVPEELAGHVESYLQFLDDFEPENALLERVVVNRRWRYMGRLDLICTLAARPDLGVGLLDIKTSRTGPFGEVACQLAAYGRGETMLSEDGLGEEPMPQVDWYGVIWVRADGYDVYPYTVDDSTFRTFLYAMQVGAAMDRDDGHVGTSRGESLKPLLAERAL